MSHWFLVAKIYFRFQKNWLGLDFIPIFSKLPFFWKIPNFWKNVQFQQKKNLFYWSKLLTWSKMTIFGSWREVESRKVLCWYSCQDHRINKQVIDITEKSSTIEFNFILYEQNATNSQHEMNFYSEQHLLVIARVPLATSFLAARLRALYSVVNFIAYKL